MIKRKYACNICEESEDAFDELMGVDFEESTTINMHNADCHICEECLVDISVIGMLKFEERIINKLNEIKSK